MTIRDGFARVSARHRWVGRAFLILLWVGSAVPAAAQTETVEYYGLDAIGSVRVVFDASGTVLARLDYAPFGRQLSSTASAPDRKFAGLFRDGEAGLDYAEARSFQVRTGRFSSPDSVYAGLFEPQRWNRYAYALNNPALFVDPDGLDPYRGRSVHGCATFASMCGGGSRSGPKGASEVTAGLVGGGDLRKPRPNPDRDGRGAGGPDRSTSTPETDSGESSGDGSPTNPPDGAPQSPAGPNPPARPRPGDKSADSTQRSVWTRIKTCTMEHYQLTALTAVSAAGATPLSKAAMGLPVVGNASHYTNLVSLVGHYFPITARFRVLGTTNIIRMAGRANPYVAGGLLAVDVGLIGACAW